MRIVDQQDDRGMLRELRNENGQAREQAHPRWFRPWRRALGCRDAPEQSGEVVEEAATQCDDFRTPARAQVAFERFRPDSKGRGAAKRITTGSEQERPIRLSALEVAAQAGLAKPSVAEQQDYSELSCGGSPVLGIQLGDFGAAANERGAQKHSQLSLGR